MRLLVCGGRHLDDARFVRAELSRLHAVNPITVLIHGGHIVLGTVLEDWARENIIHVVRYPSNWQHLGKRADIIRNAFMIDDSRPDCLLALPGGRNTLDLVYRARSAGIPIAGRLSEGDNSHDLGEADGSELSSQADRSLIADPASQPGLHP